jgi:hypothetical protein
VYRQSVLKKGVVPSSSSLINFYRKYKKREALLPLFLINFLKK